MEKKVSKKEINLYGLSASAQSIGQIVPFTYVNMFMTDYLFISAGVAGTVLLIAKIIDFIVCLVSGVIMEKVRMPWGRYASWYKVLPWIIATGCVLQMLDTTKFISSEIIRAAIVLVGYCCLHCCMSFITTARGGIMQKMAGADMNMRKTLTTRQVQFTAATSIISSAITLPAIQLMQPIAGESGGYFIVTLVFCIFYLAVMHMFVKMSQQYDPPQADFSQGKKAATIKEIFQSIATNKQMLVLVIVYTIFGIGTQLFNGLCVYYYKVIINQFSMMTLVTTIRSIVSFGASLVVPAIGKKLGKKMSLVCGMGLYAFCILGIYFFALKSIWILTLFLCLAQSGMYLYTGFGANFYLDCGEYGYYETGKDLRTIAISVMNVPTKVGFAIGGSAVSFGLAFIGYEAGMTVTPEFTSNFMLLIGLVPACLTLAAAAFAFFFYKLTDEQAEFYAKENEKRELALKNAEIQAQ